MRSNGGFNAAVIIRKPQRQLLLAIAEAVREGDRDLAASLRRRAATSTAVDTDLTRLATLFAELQSMGERDRHAAVELMETFTGYARSKRRR